MTSFYRRYGTTIIAIVIIAISFLFGFYFGGEYRPEQERVVDVINKEASNPGDVGDFNSFWKVWNVIEERSLSLSIPQTWECTPVDQQYTTI